MPANFHVNSKTILKEDESLPRPDLVDADLEKHELRKGFAPDEGRLSVTIEPGEDYIGQLTINTQFEGKFVEGDTSRFNAGQCSHNAYLKDITAWLRDALSSLSADGVEWDVAIASKPCPGSTVPPAIDEAANIIEELNSVIVIIEPSVTHGPSHQVIQ